MLQQPAPPDINICPKTRSSKLTQFFEGGGMLSSFSLLFSSEDGDKIFGGHILVQFKRFEFQLNYMPAVDGDIPRTRFTVGVVLLWMGIKDEELRTQ